jgi:hypothetical protein
MSAIRKVRFLNGCLLAWGVLVLLSCQAQSAPASLPAQVFARGRKLTYLVSRVAAGSPQAQPDTMVLTSFGLHQKHTVYDFPTGHTTLHMEQINLGYSYGAHASINSFSGVFDHDSLLWMHPPRDGAYAILELSPYPYIQLPAGTGHQWTWDLEVGDNWSNPKWAIWRGLIRVRSQYKIMGQQELSTPLGLLRCWLVQARASSPVGGSALDLWYHPAYGFVQMKYRDIKNNQLTFKLLSMSTGQLPAPAGTQQPYHFSLSKDNLSK